jgi:hypothetical protein
MELVRFRFGARNPGTAGTLARSPSIENMELVRVRKNNEPVFRIRDILLRTLILGSVL